jgi:hypothetical protein
MTLDASGNLLVGATSGTYKLNVTSGKTIALHADVDNCYAIANSAMFVATTTASPIIFQTNSAERARIDASGNLGIGTTLPSASAILDAQSTTKGVRMPNMTTTQKNAIASPAAGLMVFDTTLAKLCVYTGAAWQTITSV